MKKLIAAALLTIYLFNIGGQLVLHQYFNYRSDKFFNEQTSKGLYNIHDLTEVKIPVNMPGITDWKHYENIKGQIQLGDISYNYVKMKITRTAMYLMCIPNYKTTRLAGKNIIGANKVNDVPIPKKDHVPYGKKSLSSQFSFAFIQFRFNTPIKNARSIIVQPVLHLHYQTTAIPEQPPKLAC